MFDPPVIHMMLAQRQVLAEIWQFFLILGQGHQNHTNSSSIQANLI